MLAVTYGDGASCSMQTPLEIALSLARARGWSEAELERRAGFHAGRITRWKKGEGFPRANHLAKLAGALAVPVARLTGEASGTGDVWRPALEELVERHGAERCVTWIQAGAGALPAVPATPLPVVAGDTLDVRQVPPITPPAPRRKGN
jgi:transcriptional regulator with XRE-family HTH domain